MTATRLALPLENPRFRVALVALVGVVALIYVAFGIATASYTLGCDYAAYSSAASRFLAGQPIYDLTITKTGECNQYQYPPTFVVLALPFSLLGPVLGNAAWMGFLIGCFVVGCAAMPVRWEIRLVIFLLGAIGWPFIFGVRIGQVAPILFVLFSLGWRWVERPAVVGAIAGLGTLIKLQPIVILGWLAARRAWRGVAIGLAVIAVIAGVAAALGLGAWADMVTLLRNLANATDIPVNAALGSRLYQHGLSLGAANAVQLSATLLTLALVAVCGWRSSTEAGYLVAVVASQLVSPIVWTHYALILLLPVAWLIQRGHWWAFLIPLSQAWVLIPFASLDLYPVAFYAALLAVPVVDWQQRRGRTELVASPA